MLDEQAEELRLSLMMGLVNPQDVIEWADKIILSTSAPPEWVLDLSLATNQTPDALEVMLRRDRFDGNKLSSAYAALDRLALAFDWVNISTDDSVRALATWAASASVNQHDRDKAMGPKWLSDEVEHGYARHQDVADAVTDALAHFKAAQNSEGPK